MEQDRKKSDKFFEFMGAWMAGAFVGRVVIKILSFIFIVWLLMLATKSCGAG